MPARSKLPLVGALVLFIAGACDDTYACRWTDEPFPDPVATHELNRRYATDDGAFEIVLHAEGEWPPAPGTTSLTVECVAADAELEAAPTLYADRPFVYDGELTSPTEPTVGATGPREWRIDALALTAEGVWAVPIWIEQGELDDSIELHLEVVAPED